MLNDPSPARPNDAAPAAPAKPSYCRAVRAGGLHPVHRVYHDTAYGFPRRQDHALFERLVLEINQAGLSWELMLKRQDGFRRAYDGFDLDRVAAYGDDDTARLLADPGIIRNRRKVAAAIENARRLGRLRDEHGGVAAWLDRHHPRSKEAWVQLFRRTLVFTGPEVVGEFLVSTGYLPGAHDPDCPVHAEIRALGAPWTR